MIQRMVGKLVPHDESGPWSLRDATPDEARVELEVLVDMFERTEGRVWLTKEVARWIVKILRPRLSFPQFLCSP